MDSVLKCLFFLQIHELSTRNNPAISLNAVKKYYAALTIEHGTYVVSEVSLDLNQAENAWVNLEWCLAGQLIINIDIKIIEFGAGKAVVVRKALSINISNNIS